MNVGFPCQVVKVCHRRSGHRSARHGEGFFCGLERRQVVFVVIPGVHRSGLRSHDGRHVCVCGQFRVGAAGGLNGDHVIVFAVEQGAQTLSGCRRRTAAAAATAHRLVVPFAYFRNSFAEDR